jgi:hypothetical protein
VIFVVRISFVTVFLSADSVEESFALKFVQQAHIQKTGHLFLVFSERGNEIAPAIGFGSRNFCHAFRIEAIGLLQGNARNPDRRLLKKTQRRTKEMGCWNMGILESWVLNVSIHHSILPSFQSLLRWSEAFKRNEAYEAFSAACSVVRNKGG